MVDENQLVSSNFVSTSVGSSIKIDSISIDLVGVDDKISAAKCERFSIRGYVSEVRKRNSEKCWPFALSADKQSPGEHTYKLPPLLVPKSRWWRCENCVREANADGSINESDMLLTSCSNQTSLPKKHNGPASASVKNAEVATNPLSMDHNAKHKVASFIGSSMGVIPVPKSQLTDKIVLETDFNRSMEPHTVRQKSQETAAHELASKSCDRMIRSMMKTKEKGKEVFMNGKHSKCMTTPVSTEIAGVVDGATKFIEAVSLERDKCDNVPPGSVVLARKVHQSCQPDNIAPLHRGKTQKSRLLSELLGKDRDGNTTGKELSSSVCPHISQGSKTSSALKVEASMHVKSRKQLPRNKKRKSQEDEEWKPPEMISLNRYVKQKFSLGGTSSETSGFTDSFDSGHTLLSGEDLMTDVEYQTSKKVEKNVNNIKTKIKKDHLIGQQISIPVSKESFQKDIPKAAKDSANGLPTENCLLSFRNFGIKGNEFGPCPTHAWKTEANSFPSKEKGKLPVVRSNKSSPLLGKVGMSEATTTSEGDHEILQRKLVAVPFMPKPVATAEKGLDLSLKWHSHSELRDEGFISQFEGQPGFAWPWQEGTSNDSNSRLADHHDCFPSNSEPYAFLQRGLPLDFFTRESGSRASFRKEKEKTIPETADPNWSSIERLDTSKARSKGKGIKICEHYQPEEIPIKQREVKEHEISALDEGTMEIAELMAKIQYERGLSDAEERKKHKLQGMGDNDRLQLIDLNKAYENGSSNVSQDERYWETNPFIKDRKYNEVTRAENISVPKRNFISLSAHAQRNHYNINKFSRPSVNSGFWAFSQNREKPPGSMQFTTFSPSRQSVPSSQFIGNMVSQGCASSSFRMLKPCNTCQSIPQPSKGEGHIWPSNVLNTMPIGDNIRQKHIDQAKTMDQIPSGGIARYENLNRWDLDPVENEKKKGIQGEYSGGIRSLDPHSNDSIPAMHLLSLMDAGLRSSTSVEPARNLKMNEKPSLYQGFSGKDILAGQHGHANNSINVPSDCASKEVLLDSFLGRCSPFSVGHDKGLSGLVGLTAETSLRTQEKWNMKDILPADGGSYKTQKSGFRNVDMEKIGSLVALDTKNLIQGSPDSSRITSRHLVNEYSSRHRGKVHKDNTSIFPPRTDSGPLICGINKNPAEFTLPDEGNVYMLKGEDLKFKKRSGFGKKTFTWKPDVTKRKRRALLRKDLSK